jgi:RHS repeat-associated protein
MLIKRITDANGNRSEAVFDAFALVVGNAAMGKESENVGDSLAGFEPDLDEAALLAHVDDPFADPGAVLANASSRLIYDVAAYYRTRDEPQPRSPAIYTVSRETHVSDVAPGQQTRYQHAFSYSDGFGREIQRKIQAEPGPIDGLEGDVSRRWVGSGWTIINNKGHAVRKYEPFFSATHQFEFARKVGVSTVLFYDPLGRVVATLHPDNTWEKTVFDSWRQTTWDANDTVLASDPRADPDVGNALQRFLGKDADAFVPWYERRIAGAWGDIPETRAAEQDAALKTVNHASTPLAAHFDSLGRKCLTVSNNGTAGRYPSRTVLDSEGRRLAVFDSVGRHLFEYCLRESLDSAGIRYLIGHDLVGKALYQSGMDGGERRTLPNAAGRPIRSWDSRGHAFRVRYDLLQRQTQRYVSSWGQPETLLERSVYGEGLPDRNLCGRLFRQYDTAGLAGHERYDFKGNLLEGTRQLGLDYRTSPDWTLLGELTDAPALDAAAAPLLSKADRFTATTTYDALNRPIQLVTPHSTATRPTVLRPTYNEANLLVRLDIWIRQTDAPASLLEPETADRRVVVDIDYNARGQRTRFVLANGTVTTYEYDKETFRLTHMLTTRDAATFPDDCRNPPPSGWPGCQIQNLFYAYDPVGNITRIRDDAQQTIFFRNKRVVPSSDYTYDPLYRLTRAVGREHVGQTAGDLIAPVQVENSDASRNVLQPVDGKAMGTYVETYGYDPVGNLKQMVHHVGSGGWTRYYAYTAPSQIVPTESSNRLSATSLPGDDEDGPYAATYGYDAHGNVIRMPHLPNLGWDERDRLRSTTRQVANGNTPETTFNVYDAGGERLRKVTDRPAESGVEQTRSRQRVYLGPIEIYREYALDGESITLERETLDVHAARDRVALIETRTIGEDPGSGQQVRYQYTNHLGSATLELNDGAAIISYEEFFPYGSTAYCAVQTQTETPKRYRYTGKERDDENDLYYHRARYYASWLGRWISCDPTGMFGGSNPYAYVTNNPVRLVDPNGTGPEDLDLVGIGEGGLLNLPPASAAASTSNVSELNLVPERYRVKIRYKADIGDIAKYRLQGRARWDPSTGGLGSATKLTEPEHPIARVVRQQFDSSYGETQYRNTETLVQDRPVAIAKTTGDVRLARTIEESANLGSPMSWSEAVARSKANWIRSWGNFWAQQTEFYGPEIELSAVESAAERAGQALPPSARAVSPPASTSGPKPSGEAAPAEPRPATAGPSPSKSAGEAGFADAELRDLGVGFVEGVAEGVLTLGPLATAGSHEEVAEVGGQLVAAALVIRVLGPWGMLIGGSLLLAAQPGGPPPGPSQGTEGAGPN